MGAIIASAYNSCNGAPWTYIMYRGKPVLDGQYTTNFTDICPTTNCIKIASGDYLEEGTWVVPNPQDRAVYMTCPFGPEVN